MSNYTKFPEETAIAKELFNLNGVDTDIVVVGDTEWQESLHETLDKSAFYHVTENKVYIQYSATLCTGAEYLIKNVACRPEVYSKLGTLIIGIHELSHVLDNYLKEEIPPQGSLKHSRVEIFPLQKGIDIIDKLPPEFLDKAKCNLTHPNQRYYLKKMHIKEAKSNLCDIGVVQWKKANREFKKKRIQGVLTRSN